MGDAADDKSIVAERRIWLNEFQIMFKNSMYRALLKNNIIIMYIYIYTYECIGRRWCYRQKNICQLNLSVVIGPGIITNVTLTHPSQFLTWSSWIMESYMYIVWPRNSDGKNQMIYRTVCCHRRGEAVAGLPVKPFLGAILMVISICRLILRGNENAISH